MSNKIIEKYQQDLVDKLLKEMKSNNDFIKSWSNIPFMPYNGSANNFYNGINQINLSMYLVQTQSADPRFYSFNQIKNTNGLSLKKGAKGIQIQFYKLFDKEVENDNGEVELKKIPFTRLTYVFNGKDINGLEPYEKTNGFNSLEDNRDLMTKLQEVIKNSSIEIKHGGNKAFYLGGDKDVIMMPPPERFSSQEAYVATLLHELAHSTGHNTRQNRNMSGSFGSESYAKEELRAELSSVFMCQKLGISYNLENDQSHIENSAAYLNSWMKTIKNDKKEFFNAVKDATKITNFLIDGKSFENDIYKSHNVKENISLNGVFNENDFQSAVNEVWDNKNLRTRGSIINLGATPDILQKLDIPNVPLIMKYSKLFDIKKNHNLDKETLKNIPKQINNPVMVFKNKRNQAKNSFVILTEFEDKNKKPVIVALISKIQQNKIEVNKIASIYGRNVSQIENALKHNELVYRHIEKSQSIMSRLQLPSALLTDSKRILTNKSIKVKKQHKNKSTRER